MSLSKAALREKLLQWEGVLTDYALPEWEDFPALPLYMDQVIFLLNRYLILLPEQAQERQVTPAMINNYVKLKIVPPPVKKRYERRHLAYLVIVCVCKQTLNTSDIKKLVPLSLPEAEVREIYGGFTSAFREIQQYFRQEVRKAVRPVFDEPGEPLAHFLFRTAAAANLTTLLTEQILRLDGETPPIVPEPGAAPD